MDKFLIAFASVFLLSGCASSLNVTTTPVERAPLEILTANPLVLKPVQFHVFVKDGAPYYSLDTQDFSNLANNMEKIENRLDLDEQIILEQKNYYEAVTK